MRPLILALGPLLALGLPPAAAPARAAAPEPATAVMVGPTLGLAGVGVALRHHVTPWLGYQVGATAGIFAAAGGTVMLAPLATPSSRLYVSAGGGGMAVSGTGTPFWALGVGGSHQVWGPLVATLDVSWVQGDPTVSRIPFPQLGLLYRL